jgi:hypothetical protein
VLNRWHSFSRDILVKAHKHRHPVHTEVKVVERHYRYNDSESVDPDNLDGRDPIETAQPDPGQNRESHSLNDLKKSQDDDE